MANWKYKLDLIDLRTAYDNEEITAQEFGKKVAERIKKQPWYKEEEDYLEDIADRFEIVEDIYEFDEVLNDLYDWGDTTLPTPRRQMPIFNKKCWIAMVF